MLNTGRIYIDCGKSKNCFQERVKEFYENFELGYIVGGAIDDLDENKKAHLTIRHILKIVDDNQDTINKNGLDRDIKRNLVKQYCIKNNYCSCNKNKDDLSEEINF